MVKRVAEIRLSHFNFPLLPMDLEDTESRKRFRDTPKGPILVAAMANLSSLP